MLDFGFGEIVLTSFVALVVLGPEKLPKVARQVGNWMGRARAMARQLSEQLEREVDAEELLKLQNKPSSDSLKAGATTTPTTATPPAIAPSTSMAPQPTIATPPSIAPPASIATAPPPAGAGAETRCSTSRSIES